jgi:hypothetical protein
MVAIRLALILLLTSFLLPSSAHAADGRFSISGTVVDPSGVGVSNARVTLETSVDGTARAASTDTSGVFRFSSLPPGAFQVRVDAEGFAEARISVAITGRSPSDIKIPLKIASMRQEITVSEAAGQVNTEASANLDVITLDREMLDNLPIFDQNYVSAMSQFLDPGSIATGGVALVVNGMEQKSIGVSASAIQQVKINQNPYSAEFSRPGRGRIEILTKPESQVYHGSLNVLFRDYRMNARDPFAASRPQEQRRIFEGNLVGPLGKSGKNSFLISANREEQDLQAIVFASAPSGLVQQNVANPQRNTEFSAGVTHQFSATHLGSFRGSYRFVNEQNRGVGGFVLPEAGVNYEDREDELMYNDSLVVNPKLINQFRIMFGRQHTPTTSVNQDPSVVVLGAFTGGGAQADRLQTENHISMNEIASWSVGKHQIKAGINVPDISRRGLNDHTNAGGTYTFSSMQDYLQNRPFSLVQQQGNGKVVFLETVVGGFFQDDFRLRPNLTIAAGIRYDWQNFFHDNNEFSPRVSFAFAPTKDRKTVLRGGGGIFYDRTGPQPILDIERYNGLRLQQIVWTNPPYPAPASELTSRPTSLTRLDPSIHMPYTAQFSFGVERQLYAGTTLSATYWATRGISLFRSRDVNAPQPPYYLERPDPALSVYRQIESSGHLQNDSLEISFRGRLSRYFNGMIQYTLGRAYNDVGGNYSASTRTTGINAFPANNYDLSGEWARADYDQRHRLSLLGTVHAAKYLDFGLGLFANTGAPYSETTGRDDNRDGLANDRPSGVRRNSLEGPKFAELDLRWSHDFLLQKSKKESPRATIALDAFNLTNTVNYATYIGNLSSPFFGHAVAAKPSRRLQLTAKFVF